VGREVWAFDVDGTLIGSIRSDRLRPGAVELLTELGARRIPRVLWSAGGADYAARMARKHEIDSHFVGFYAKLDRGSDGRFHVDHLASDHMPSTFVDDAPDEVPSGARVIRVPPFLGGNMADSDLRGVLADLDRILQQ
jgi:long-chain acyl-CoA synthetase